MLAPNTGKIGTLDTVVKVKDCTWCLAQGGESGQQDAKHAEHDAERTPSTMPGIKGKAQLQHCIKACAKTSGWGSTSAEA